MDFNRKAVKLTGDKKKEFPGAQKGFLWNSGDSKTLKFRPQGITNIKVGEGATGRELVIVSWYGRSEADYANRGARISVVDVTRLANTPDENNYRHILLVDKDGDTFSDASLAGDKGTLHAGGILVIDGKLHVADSRGDHKKMRVFDLNKIQIKTEANAIHGYRHLLVEEYNYNAPIKASYVSYDRDKKQILMGTFQEKPSTAKPMLLTWFTPPSAAGVTKFNQDIDKLAVYRLPNKFKKGQGVVSSNDGNGGQVLWLATSFGSTRRSNFYKINVKIDANTPKYTAANPDNIITVSKSSSSKYPPGLEDLCLTSEKHLWMLTEFPYAKNKYLPLSYPAIKNDAEKALAKSLFQYSQSTRRAVFYVQK